MKIDIYRALTYVEDEIKRNPVAYSQNGNRKCQHVKISNNGQVKEFLNRYGLFKDEYPEEKWKDICEVLGVAEKDSLTSIELGVIKATPQIH